MNETTKIICSLTKGANASLAILVGGIIGLAGAMGVVTAKVNKMQKTLDNSNVILCGKSTETSKEEA